MIESCWILPLKDVIRMKALLMQYDVSNLQPRRLPQPETSERRNSRDLIQEEETQNYDLQLAKMSSKVFMAVMTNFLLLQTHVGAKGARLLRVPLSRLENLHIC